MSDPQSIFSYRPYWAKRFGVAPFLPMSQEEMDQLGWDACDIILVTGDAYVDHPSFGMAIVGRLLEAQGFRVGILSQPDWRDAEPFTALGRPNLFFGVTAGNMDSMVNRYTADRLPRSNDAYTPNDEGGRRPDRATVAYAQRCKQAYREVPVVLGGIEASLRRVAHFDYWSEKVRRSMLADAKADLLLYGNAERAVVALAHRLAGGESVEAIRDLRGSAYLMTGEPEGLRVQDERGLDCPRIKGERATALRLPGYDAVKSDPALYAHASRLLYNESNPYNARTLIQDQGARTLVVNPPPLPLTTEELDGLYELPFQRRPHPGYGKARIPAYEMIRFSIPIMRGCFGGCTFCSITAHEGRIIQDRSEASILREIETIRDQVPEFSGHISDLGGPTANMWRLHCKDPQREAVCRRLSCIYPDICSAMETSHKPLTRLYRKARGLPGIKRVFVASGLRYDLANRDPEYVKELTQHHVGGYLKIAPEHTEPETLALMMKPGMECYDRFRALFQRYSEQANKEQYLIPYFIAAHPGSSDEEMLRLALWLKEQGLRLDQVQGFIPTPMTLATTMYHTGFNPLKRIRKGVAPIYTAKGLRQRRLHKALLRYHDRESWPLIREALEHMGRTDLIGYGKRHLVPPGPGRGGKSTGGDKVEAKGERAGFKPRSKPGAKSERRPNRAQRRGGPKKRR